MSDQFIEQWSEVSRQAEMSFLALVVLHYREQHDGMERKCYDMVPGLKSPSPLKQCRSEGLFFTELFLTNFIYIALANPV